PQALPSGYARGQIKICICLQAIPQAIYSTIFDLRGLRRRLRLCFRANKNLHIPAGYAESALMHNIQIHHHPLVLQFCSPLTSLLRRFPVLHFTYAQIAESYAFNLLHSRIFIIYHLHNLPFHSTHLHRSLTYLPAVQLPVRNLIYPLPLYLPALLHPLTYVPVLYALFCNSILTCSPLTSLLRRFPVLHSA
ncbi:hypothetical protein T02_320, partial [Trichinella nativa]